MESKSPAVRGDDYSVKLLRPVFHWVREQHGEEALRKIAAEVGLTRDQLLSPATWLSHDQFEAAASAARALVDTDEEFLKACGFQLAQSFGPMLFVLRATSPLQFFQISTRTLHLVSHVGRFELLDRSTTHVRVRYTSQRPESRLVCLSRQAWGRAVPELLGLPPAQFQEESCIARGDDACVYRFGWYEPTSLWPASAGAVLGLGLAALVQFAGNPGWVAWLALPVAGGAIGLAFAMRRASRRNLAYGSESHRALEALAEEHSEAVIQLRELARRNENWSHALERRLHEREATLDSLTQEFESVRERDRASLAHLRHDLNNPMTVLRFVEETLGEHAVSSPDIGQRREYQQLSDDMRFALGKMTPLFDALKDMVDSEAGLPKLKPEEIPVTPLVDQVRLLLRALVSHRGVKVSVFQTREAPAVVTTDRFLFSRVIDEIVSNAAKYTDRGSILVEIGGVPEALCVKVSDTGRGIAGERLEKAFTGVVPDDDPLLGDSHGLGLSIVVSLLDRLGGRLEVMSRPGLGTTFWVYIPVKPPELQLQPARMGAALDDVVKRIVTVRRVVNDS